MMKYFLFAVILLLNDSTAAKPIEEAAIDMVFYEDNILTLKSLLTVEVHSPDNRPLENAQVNSVSPGHLYVADGKTGTRSNSFLDAFVSEDGKVPEPQAEELIFQVDACGQPYSGVNISVCRMREPRECWRGVTDSNGRFVLDEPQIGQYVYEAGDRWNSQNGQCFFNGGHEVVRFDLEC